MSKRDYPRLSIEDFGRHLVTSGDLDPVYFALGNLELAGPELSRWLVAYWCFYNVGAACWLSEDHEPGFWSWMGQAARNVHPAPTGGRWPRGQERRHFRGQAAIRAVDALGQLYPEPARMVEDLARAPEDGRLTCAEVIERTKRHHLFGPWIGFKVADMLERVRHVPVDFSAAEVFMFDQPREAALLLWRQRVVGVGADLNARPRDEEKAIGSVVAYLVDEFRDLAAPPSGDRPVGLQEVETILCKWKSHLSGHYPLWNDVDEINDGLEPWLEHSELARRFHRAMPPRQVGVAT